MARNSGCRAGTGRIPTSPTSTRPARTPRSSGRCARRTATGTPSSRTTNWRRCSRSTSSGTSRRPNGFRWKRDSRRRCPSCSFPLKRLRKALNDAFPSSTSIRSSSIACFTFARFSRRTATREADECSWTTRRSSSSGPRARFFLQNQSFTLLEENVDEFEQFFGALKNKQQAGLDVRIIFRDAREFSQANGPKQQKLLERLKHFGFDTDLIRRPDALPHEGDHRGPAQRRAP